MKVRKYTAVSPSDRGRVTLHFVVETGVEAAQIHDLILKNGGNYLRSVRTFDVLPESPQAALGEGKKVSLLHWNLILPKRHLKMLRSKHQCDCQRAYNQVLARS